MHSNFKFSYSDELYISGLFVLIVILVLHIYNIYMSELQLFGAVEIFALFGSSFESIETFVIVASLGV